MVTYWSPQELIDMAQCDAKINRQFAIDNQRNKRHKRAYQKRYGREHKEEIKVKQHNYYLNKKAASLLEQESGAVENISIK